MPEKKKLEKIFQKKGERSTMQQRIELNQWIFKSKDLKIQRIANRFLVPCITYIQVDYEYFSAVKKYLNKDLQWQKIHQQTPNQLDTSQDMEQFRQIKSFFQEKNKNLQKVNKKLLESIKNHWTKIQLSEFSYRLVQQNLQLQKRNLIRTTLINTMKKTENQYKSLQIYLDQKINVLKERIQKIGKKIDSLYIQFSDDNQRILCSQQQFPNEEGIIAQKSRHIVNDSFQHKNKIDIKKTLIKSPLTTVDKLQTKKKLFKRNNKSLQPNTNSDLNEINSINSNYKYEKIIHVKPNTQQDFQSIDISDQNNTPNEQIQNSKKNFFKCKKQKDDLLDRLSKQDFEQIQTDFFDFIDFNVFSYISNRIVNNKLKYVLITNFKESVWVSEEDEIKLDMYIKKSRTSDNKIFLILSQIAVILDQCDVQQVDIYICNKRVVQQLNKNYQISNKTNSKQMQFIFHLKKDNQWRFINLKELDELKN